VQAATVADAARVGEAVHAPAVRRRHWQVLGHLRSPPELDLAHRLLIAELEP
jgi:hypothetical protein